MLRSIFKAWHVSRDDCIILDCSPASRKKWRCQTLHRNRHPVLFPCDRHWRPLLVQAAKVLEKEGTPTQVFMIYSAIQGIAAAQAGVSVIQPNVGRTRDWYNRHPGVIRDPKGPREDTGFTSRIDPGIGLVTELYTYIKKYHPKTAVMASGIRTKEGG